VKLFIQQSAEDDMLRQVEWYAGQGLPDIARRFHWATLEAIDALLAMPEAGAPRPTGNPRVAGVRSWSVKAFDEFRVDHQIQAELLTIVRVLDGKRDTAAILKRRDLTRPPGA
jgi:plasmid stabilization system protein ParE